MIRQGGHPAFSALKSLKRERAAVTAKPDDSVQDEGESKAAERQAAAARDAALWQNAVRDVLPNRRRDDHAELSVTPPPPLPRQRELGEARALAESMREADGLD
ncbi:MAG: hypothetical protein LBI31_02630, partial [Zoogloeaceae bacterium]|nr:hypothetical protein [Zoogloeaceae bacterium]